jgi:hypothetical protein
MPQIKTKFLENLAVTNAKVANTTIDLATKVTGVLPVANGGSGSATDIKADRQLSNLTGTVAISQHLTFDMAGFSAVRTKDASAATKTLILESGDVTGAFLSGQVTMRSGTSSLGSTGDINVHSASANTASGAVALFSGDSTTTTSGNVSIKSGDASTISGSINIQTGTGTTRGNVTLDGQDLRVGAYTDAFWGTPGFGVLMPQTSALDHVLFSTEDHATNSTDLGMDVTLSTGSKNGATSTNKTGNAYITTGWHQGTGDSGFMILATGDKFAATTGNTGDMEVYSGFNGGTGNSGTMDVLTGDTNVGNSGVLSIYTGDATTGNSGSLRLLVGTASGTQGNFRFHKLGTTVTVGHVWKATSTTGDGYWAAEAADTGITQLTGDVTAGPGSGSQVATIATNAVTTTKIINNAVTSAKLDILYAGTLTTSDLNPDDALKIKDSTSTKRNIAYIVDATALNGSFPTYTVDSLIVGPGKAGEAAQFASSATFSSSIPGGGNDVDSGDAIFGSGAALHIAGVNTGKIFITSGYIFNSGAASTTGETRIETGSTRNALNTLNAAGTTGDMLIKSGDTTGTSGNLVIATGDNAGANATNSGNLTLQTGLASGTRGVINLNASMITTYASIVPDTQLAYDLGGSGLEFSNIYVDSIYGSGMCGVKIFDVLNATALDTSAVISVNFAQRTLISSQGGSNGIRWINDTAGLELMPTTLATARPLSLMNGAGSFAANIRAPALTASYTLTLPVDDGTANQVMTTDGSGVLSWTTPAAASTWSRQSFTLILADITAGNITLANDPIDASVIMVVGGLVSRLGADYTLTGTTLDFSGHTPALAIGDIVTVQYQY